MCRLWWISWIRRILLGGGILKGYPVLDLWELGAQEQMALDGTMFENTSMDLSLKITRCADKKKSIHIVR